MAFISNLPLRITASCWDGSSVTSKPSFTKSARSSSFSSTSSVGPRSIVSLRRFSLPQSQFSLVKPSSSSLPQLPLPSSVFSQIKPLSKILKVANQILILVIDFWAYLLKLPLRGLKSICGLIHKVVSYLNHKVVVLETIKLVSDTKYFQKIHLSSDHMLKTSGCLSIPKADETIVITDILPYFCEYFETIRSAVLKTEDGTLLKSEVLEDIHIRLTDNLSGETKNLIRHLIIYLKSLRTDHFKLYKQFLKEEMLELCNTFSKCPNRIIPDLRNCYFIYIAPQLDLESMSFKNLLIKWLQEHREAVFQEVGIRTIHVHKEGNKDVADALNFCRHQLYEELGLEQFAVAQRYNHDSQLISTVKTEFMSQYTPEKIAQAFIQQMHTPSRKSLKIGYQLFQAECWDRLNLTPKELILYNEDFLPEAFYVKPLAQLCCHFSWFQDSELHE